MLKTDLFMTANELRKKYIDFFKSKNHTEIFSSSLIPENDPSVLFTTAGMHPLVPFLMGNKHPAGDRLVNVQKCVRTGDIDEVGDDTHLTFFEMLGNWSLGSYFKDESIEMSFEFLTSKKWLGLDLSRLAISVFEDEKDFDLVSYEKWVELGIPESRIAKLGKKDNWWPAGGKNKGPQGPDTEIFYWTGNGNAPIEFDPDDSDWVEIWNNVFMEYFSDGDILTQLEQKNVDTGMGLERTIVALQGRNDVYETELFAPAITVIENLSGRKYRENSRNTKSMRIIADHIRSASMIISDGVIPSNKDQGYILRRLIRRAVRESMKLNDKGFDMVEVVKATIKPLEDVYQLEEFLDGIISEISKEQKKFEKTLKKGLQKFKKMYEKDGSISGETAFLLYSTYGFPLELTEELVIEHGGEVDRKNFEIEFEKHKQLSSTAAAGKFKGGLADDSEKTKKLHTAAHLMLEALRRVLGDQVEQRGSNITSERLRFDFSYDKKLSEDQIAKIEKIVNDQIDKGLEVRFEEMTLEEAELSGAVGIFKNKYKDLNNKIKVYSIGDFSKEICGGPHVKNIANLGRFSIKKQESSSAGVRRIKAVLD